MRIGIGLDAKRRNHREVDGFARLGGRLQFRLLVRQRGVVRRRHDILPRPVFHFADVYDAVAPVDQKIDLRVRVPPGMHVRKNARYAERVPDAVYVLEAKPLKRKPGPCRMRARIGHSRPVMAVVGCVRLHEPEVKKRKVVDQLENRTLCPLPEF